MNVQSAPIVNRILSSPAVFPAIFASFIAWILKWNWQLESCRSHTWKLSIRIKFSSKVSSQLWDILTVNYDKHTCQINCKATNRNIEKFPHRFEDQQLRTDVVRRFIRSVVIINYASNSLSITSSISNCSVSLGLRLYLAKTAQISLWWLPLKKRVSLNQGGSPLAWHHVLPRQSLWRIFCWLNYRNNGSAICWLF